MRSLPLKRSWQTSKKITERRNALVLSFIIFHLSRGLKTFHSLSSRMDTKEMIELYKDIRTSFMEFYVQHTKKTESGEMELKEILDRFNILDLYLREDYKTLWLLERSERQIEKRIRQLRAPERESNMTYFN